MPPLHSHPPLATHTHISSCYCFQVPNLPDLATAPAASLHIIIHPNPTAAAAAAAINHYAYTTCRPYCALHHLLVTPSLLPRPGYAQQRDCRQTTPPIYCHLCLRLLMLQTHLIPTTATTRPSQASSMPITIPPKHPPNHSRPFLAAAARSKTANNTS
jgi:hypothetical protein